MANQVVVPFPGSRLQSTAERGLSSSEWRPLPRRASRPSVPPVGRFVGSRWAARFSTAREVLRAVVETISYMHEARVRPPVPALPPAPKAK